MEFLKVVASFFISIVIAVGGLFNAPVAENRPIMKFITPIVQPTVQGTVQPTVSDSPSPTSISDSATSLGYTSQQLLLMADNKYAGGSVPLGDDRYVTSSPKRGYVYLCNVHRDNPGSMTLGPWVMGTSWNFLQKISVSGSVSWPSAAFSNTVAGAVRTLAGNGLPINHTTGVFPVASFDSAHAYDANPNSISVQTLKKDVPTSPAYSDTPYCMGGEVGIMLSGVVLFNAFDAGLRDAPAHELQDWCDGHPQGSGEYHYHSLPNCFKDIGISTVMGYALDGFPITGPLVASGKYLTTEDLDECHGLTSEVLVDGVKKVTYHYVLTHDFPYSASCFRAKPVSYTVVQGGAASQSISGAGSQVSPQQGGAPPQDAITACLGKTNGAPCSVGPGYGTCRSAPDGSFACIP